MDGARYVIQHVVNPRVLSSMGLMDSARHVIQRVVNPRVLS